MGNQGRKIGWFILLLSFGVKVPAQNITPSERMNLLDEAIVRQDVNSIKGISSSDAIFMLEYQRTLRGHTHIKAYYTQLFAEQKISTMHREFQETIELGEFSIGIGSFNKTWTRISDGHTIVHDGKFWCIWRKTDGKYALFAYAEGYHRELCSDEFTTIDLGIQPKGKTNLELKAYAALDEKAIRNWDPEIRIELFADDAIFYPFADTAKAGMDVLKLYLRAYHQPGVEIDYIRGEPFEYFNFQGYVLQFSTFEVDWRFKEASGTNTGKGIRIWKRQEDGSLRIYRQIALHNYLNP